MNLQNKRFLALCLAVLLLVPVLACGAAAAESYIFELMPDVEYLDDDSMIFDPGLGMYQYSGILPEGAYMIRFVQDAYVAETTAPVSVVYSLEHDEVDGDVYFFKSACTVRVPIDPKYSETGWLDVNVWVAVQYFPDCPDLGTFSCFFESDDGTDRIFEDAAYMEFIPVDFFSVLTSSVSDGLDNVIAWVGMVLTSLLSGPLIPLLIIMAVPISVTALVFSIKAIKRITWAA